MEVDPWALREPTDDPPSLAPFQRAIRVQLVLEDPFAGDDVGVRQSRDECLGAIGLQRVEFLLHRREPRRITEGRAH